jgi:hypothetical protein
VSASPLDLGDAAADEMRALRICVETDPMTDRPLAIDLFCGLGGWTDGLLAEGYRVVGFDLVRHCYGAAQYPAPLVLQDVRTIHGAQFKSAALIVASPPCQAYSYRAMPWTRAKALPPPDNALFEACFRIQREASDAAGQHIPLVVENVCGAQKWVGRARWHYGSFYLWGDVPALMPIVRGVRKTAMAYAHHGSWKNVEGDDWRSTKNSGGSWFPQGNGASIVNNHGRDKLTKNNGGSWFNVAHNTTSGHGQNPDGRNTIANAQDGRKQAGSGAAWWRGEVGMLPSHSSRRQAASAHIAKIPLPLARHIARAWSPCG